MLHNNDQHFQEIPYQRYPLIPDYFQNLCIHTLYKEYLHHTEYCHNMLDMRYHAEYHHLLHELSDIILHWDIAEFFLFYNDASMECEF